MALNSHVGDIVDSVNSFSTPYYWWTYNPPAATEDKKSRALKLAIALDSAGVVSVGDSKEKFLKLVDALEKAL